MEVDACAKRNSLKVVLKYHTHENVNPYRRRMSKQPTANMEAYKQNTSGKLYIPQMNEAIYVKLVKTY